MLQMTKNEYEKYNNEQGIRFSQERIELATDSLTKDYYYDWLQSREQNIRSLQTKIDEEYAVHGIYLDELKKTLKSAKIEIWILCGKPYTYLYEHSYFFDAENKQILEPAPDDYPSGKQ